MADVHHLVSAYPWGHKPSVASLPRWTPRLYEEILQLRLMADELQAVFYPSALPPTADATPATSTPQPAAPVEAATTKPTYSSAVKAATPLPAFGGPATKPPTKKPPQKPRLPDKAPPPPTTSRAAPQRLILRFANSSVIKAVPDPQRLRDILNEALNGASKLRAVNRSRGGNLVLHTQAAVQLREHEQKIWGTIRPYFSLLERDRPRFHLDKPWQRVVIHRVPVTTTSSSRSLAELRWSNEGVGSLADVMGMGDLCSLEGLRVVIHRVPVTTTSSSRSLAEELRWSNEGVGSLADVMGVGDLCSLEGLRKRREGLQQGVPQETDSDWSVDAETSRSSPNAPTPLPLPLPRLLTGDI
ncbi:hypothetical protein B0H13DRAFT_2300984 [Mycena leptocephala]|nr:hypothetical protein B0H13DRAFT_2300984 [Mycena leptocephala]